MAIVPRPNKRGKVRYQVRLQGHPARTFDTSREARDYDATLRRKRKRRYVMTCGDRDDVTIVATKAGRAEIKRRWPVSPFILGTYERQPGGWTPPEGAA